MALTSAGNMLPCPCCAFSIELAYREDTVFTLQPASRNDRTPKGAMVRGMKQKIRVCRQCGYSIDLPDNHQNNIWARANAARLRTLPPPAKQALVSIPESPTAPQDSPLQEGPTAANGVVPELTDADVDILALSDIQEEVPPSSTPQASPARRAASVR